MAKSPLAKGSKISIPVRNNKNVVSLHFTIPHMYLIDKNIHNFDISHLLYFGVDKKNEKIKSRIPYIRSFCEKAKGTGNSIKSVASIYDIFNQYIVFCDTVDANPFSEAGYLKYAGNDGLLRHRIKVYNPSKKLWERKHGEELGIKETTAATILSALRTALSWCGLPIELWKTQHRGFSGENTTTKGYSDDEEHLLVSRLSELFFALASQLIAAKEKNLTLPNELPVTILLGEHQEMITISTSLEDSNISRKGKKGTSVKSSAAFNMAMGAAYHLMCFFTSLNDSNVRTIAHPIIIHTDERDKSLQIVRVTSYKTRANKQVDAVLTNDIDESTSIFNVDKRDGVTFIKTLEKLSLLYGATKEGSELLFTLNDKGEISNTFNLVVINHQLTSSLNLISPYRSSCLPWFKTLFYSYRNHQVIKLKKSYNKFGKTVVNKIIEPVKSKAREVAALRNLSYCILSCYTNLSLKGIQLPLTYSIKDSEGFITISFKYRNGDEGNFTIPAADKKLIQDVEQLATELADKQQVKKNIRLLLKQGGYKEAAKDWKGMSPISSSLITRWAIDSNEYFISLQSSRWREMTSSQEYDDNNIGIVQSVLQNTLNTINKHYANGDPRLNQVILSQGIQVLEQLAEGRSLDEAKEYVENKYAIPMLAHDEWLQKKKENKAKTNPNGITCNGKQNIEGYKSFQRETNKAMGVKLPCAEYDMCYKCKSAKAVDDVQAVYKLISFIDALKEVLDQFPDAKRDVFEKIDAYEYTLDGASNRVYEEAINLFNKNGRHPRVSINHAILSLHSL
jgi:hypothetical protein